MLVTNLNAHENILKGWTLTLEDFPISCDGAHKKGYVIGTFHSCGYVSACAGCLCRSRHIARICPGSVSPSTSSDLVLMWDGNRNEQSFVKSKQEPSDRFICLKANKSLDVIYS